MPPRPDTSSSPAGHRAGFSAPAVGRRVVLRAGLLAGTGAVAAGCGLFDRVPGAPPAPAPRLPGAAALARALADEESLIAAHEAAASRHPDLAARLAGPLGDHGEHRRVLAALLDGLGGGDGRRGQDDAAGADAPAASGSAGNGSTPAPPDTSLPTGGPVPPPDDSVPPGSPAAPVEDRLQVLADLAERERRAASARTEDAVTAPADWAPLLAVLAGSESAHAATLVP